MEWKKKFFMIAAGQAASLIGSAAVQFALIWWIASESGSAVLMGISGLSAFLPAALLSPVAGILADKYPRKNICILADLFIGLAAAVFAALLWFYDMPVWSALILLTLRSAGSTFHQPAIQAMIPQIVPQENLVQAGGWNQILASGSFILGPAFGAFLYAALPLPAVLLTDLVGAVTASALLYPVQVPPVSGRSLTKTEQSWLKELREGFLVFMADPPLFLIMLVGAVYMLFYGPLSSLYPLMTSGYFAGSAWQGGAVEMLFAAGMLLSASLFGARIRVTRHLRVAYLGMFGSGAAALICGLLPPDLWAWFVFAGVCGLMGAAGNVYSIPLTAYMQASIEPAKMGRAFSIFSLISSLTMPLGLLAAGPAAEAFGVHVWFLLSGAAMCLITAAGRLLHARMEKRLSP